MNILITGASRGIGKAIAVRLSAAHRLLLVARNLPGLDGVADNLGHEILTAKADLADQRDIQWLIDFAKAKSFRPDVLVLNAGTFLEGSLLSGNLEALQDTLAVNLVSSFSLVRGFAEDLKQSTYGRVVLIGSTASLEAYAFGQFYGISKWALRGYAVNLRQELMPFGVGVTHIAPGGTLTDLWAGEELPPNRLLDPDDIAKLVEATLSLSRQAVVEEIIVRPMLGDMHH